MNIFIKKLISYLIIHSLILNTLLPTIVFAGNAITDYEVQYELEATKQFKRINNLNELYVKSPVIDVIESGRIQSDQTIKQFHQKLETNLPHRLYENKYNLYVPISGSTTFFVPLEKVEYPLAKRVGDKFVQNRIVSSQVKRLIGRAFIEDTFTSSEQQIQKLYQNAYAFAARTDHGYRFGDKISEYDVDHVIKKSFIWPEFRSINGQDVLIPVVHIPSYIIADRTIEGGHTVEFNASNATFKSAHFENTDIQLKNDTVFSTIEDLVIGENSSINIDDTDVKIYAGVSFAYDSNGDLKGINTGTLYNYGQINSQRNVNIVAGDYIQRTLVHRYQTRDGYGERLGNISSINAGNGISIQTYGDVILAGAQLNGGRGSIILLADGSISIGSVPLTSYSQINKKGYSSEETQVSYFQTRLNTQQIISLMAEGSIAISGAELVADEGMIEFMAQNNISIVNDLSSYQFTSNRTWGKNSETINELRTIVTRSALDAGKGVIMHTEYGDILMKATDIQSKEGTNITAEDGHVKLLLAKEQNHYYQHTHRENFWRIKTRTEDNKQESAVYNAVTGGILVNATKGITLELAQDKGQTRDQILKQLEEIPQLAWVKEVYDNNHIACPTPTFEQEVTGRGGYLANGAYNIYRDEAFQDCNNTFDVVYQKLENYKEIDKTRSLTPQAMAVIAIAVSVAMGPGGFELIGNAGTIGTGTIGKQLVAWGVNKMALQAAVVSLATQAASNLAAGKGVDGTLKAMISEEGARSVALAMVTAGLMDKFGDSFSLFKEGGALGDYADIANQALTAVGQSTMKAVASWAITGGSLSELDQNIINGIYMYAVEQLGQELADKIDATWALNSDVTEDIVKGYFASAAAGCLIGLATHEVMDSESTAASACSSTALGNVAGRAIANIALSVDEKNQQIADVIELYDEMEGDLNRTFVKLKKVDPENITDKQILTTLEQTDYTKKYLLPKVHKFAKAGGDYARLAVALTLFLSKADADAINFAADAAQDQAQRRYSVMGAQTLNHVVGLYKQKVDLGQIDYDSDLPEVPDDEFNDVLKSYVKFISLADVIVNQSPEAADAFIDEKVEKYFDAANISASDAEVIKSNIDYQEFKKALIQATENLVHHGGNWRPVQDSNEKISEHWEKALSVRGDYGWGSVLKNAKKIDAYQKSTGAEQLNEMSRVQIMVAQGMSAASPATIKVAQVQEKLQADHPNTVKALEFISFMMSPIQSSLWEIFSRTDAGKDFEKEIGKAHNNFTHYVADGTLHETVEAELNQTQASQATAGSMTLLTLATGPLAYLKLKEKLSKSRNSLESGDVVKGDGDPYGNGSTIKYTAENGREYLVFDPNDPNALEEFRELNPNSSLSDEDILSEMAHREFDPQTKRFSNIGGIKGRIAKFKEAPLVTEELSIGKNHTTDLQTTIDGQALTYDQVVSARAEIIKQKSALDKNSQAYKDLTNKQRALSEEIGIMNAKATIKAKFGDDAEIIEPKWDENAVQAGSLNIDLLVKYTENGSVKYAVVDGKGGSSGMGKRIVDKEAEVKEYAQQGTQEYHTSLLRDMSEKAVKMRDEGINIPTSMQETLRILKNNTVNYFTIHEGLMDVHGNKSSTSYLKTYKPKRPGQ